MSNAKKFEPGTMADMKGTCKNNTKNWSTETGDTSTTFAKKMPELERTKGTWGAGVSRP